MARNIAYGLENQKRPRAEINARVEELLDLVGLPEQAAKYPAQLSGGQQQRIALARAIASSPGLLLLDEPLSALDAKVRVHLRHEIKQLQRQLGVTTVMVTHDQEEALTMADRIVVMNDGRIEQTGSPTDIYRQPASLFVADFIGAMNKVAARAGSKGTVYLGDLKLACQAHDFSDGDQVIATIRPEDIVPQDKAKRAAGNIIWTTITAMEFLGSFWRATLSGGALAGHELLADFSINATRRFGLEPGADIKIELPGERIQLFAPDAAR